MKVMKRILAPALGLYLIGTAMPAYAEKADEPVANFLAGVFTAPFKVVHHTIDGVIKGNKNLPVLGTFSGAARGLGYGVIDSAENVGKGLFGQEISIPEEYGDVSSAVDENPLGRIAVGAAVGAGVGSWLGATEAITINSDTYSAGEAAALVGGATGVIGGVEEIVGESE